MDSRDSCHGVPVDFVAEDTGEEIPQFDLAVQAAADDCAVEAVDDDAGYVFGVFTFASVKFAWCRNGHLVRGGEICLSYLLFSCLGWRKRRRKLLTVDAGL